MFSKKNTITYLLATAGIAAIYIGIYTLLVSVHLETYTFYEYLKSDVKILAWWQIVVLPIAVGIGFIASSVISRKAKNPNGIFLAMLIISIVVVLFHVLVGVIGLLSSIFCLFNEYKHNKAIKTDG